jgi:predicted small lipoprotein YifL
VKPPSSKLGAAVLLAALALTLVSCGRRGALEPPPGAAASNAPITGTPGEEQPPPTPGEVPGQNAAAPAQAGAKQIPPHVPKPFPLDPLL